MWPRNVPYNVRDGRNDHHSQFSILLVFFGTCVIFTVSPFEYLDDAHCTVTYRSGTLLAHI